MKANIVWKVTCMTLVRNIEWIDSNTTLVDITQRHDDFTFCKSKKRKHEGTQATHARAAYDKTYKLKTRSNERKPHMNGVHI